MRNDNTGCDLSNVEEMEWLERKNLLLFSHQANFSDSMFTHSYLTLAVTEYVSVPPDLIEYVIQTLRVSLVMFADKRRRKGLMQALGVSEEDVTSRDETDFHGFVRMSCIRSQAHSLNLVMIAWLDSGQTDAVLFVMSP